MPVVCGVDGCPGGWVAVFRDLATGDMSCRVEPTLERIAGVDPRATVIGIGVPIGLVDAGAREVDIEARQLLGHPRASSVFPAPIRPVLEATSHAEASTIRLGIDGKKMSIQAWSMVARIRTVDEALRADAGLRARVREVHPELSFMAMNDGQPLTFAKRNERGRTERSTLLRRQFGVAVDRLLETRPPGCAVDDLHDAIAVVWTAERIARGDAERIPSVPPRDHFRLPMEMVF